MYGKHTKTSCMGNAPREFAGCTKVWPLTSSWPYSTLLVKSFIDPFQKKSCHQSLRHQFLLSSPLRLMMKTRNLRINHNRVRSLQLHHRLEDFVSHCQIHLYKIRYLALRDHLMIHHRPHHHLQVCQSRHEAARLRRPRRRRRRRRRRRLCRRRRPRRVRRSPPSRPPHFSLSPSPSLASLPPSDFVSLFGDMKSDTDDLPEGATLMESTTFASFAETCYGEALMLTT